MSLGSESAGAVAVVTGGSSSAGREVARGLAGWAWPVVIVYLADQWRADVTEAEITAAGGTTVKVRADLADDLDVQRLFTESIAAFGRVDVVVHTTTGDAAPLYLHATRFIRPKGAVVSTPGARRATPQVASQLREHGITVGQVAPHAVLAFLDHWWKHAVEDLSAPLQ